MLTPVVPVGTTADTIAKSSVPVAVLPDTNSNTSAATPLIVALDGAPPLPASSTPDIIQITRRCVLATPILAALVERTLDPPPLGTKVPMKETVGSVESVTNADAAATFEGPTEF